jgi:hypothetical protein
MMESYEQEEEVRDTGAMWSYVIHDMDRPNESDRTNGWLALDGARKHIIKSPSKAGWSIPHSCTKYHPDLCTTSKSQEI